MLLLSRETGGKICTKMLIMFRNPIFRSTKSFNKRDKLRKNQQSEYERITKQFDFDLLIISSDLFNYFTAGFIFF